MKESYNVSNIGNIYQMTAGYPTLVIIFLSLVRASISNLIKFILTLNSIFLIIMHLLLIKSLLSRQSESKAFIKTEIAWFILLIELLNFFMKIVQLIIAKEFSRDFAFKTVKISLGHFHINALEMEQSITILALHYLST